jgi:hypothetical protein
MSAPTTAGFAMAELLERSGFRLRGKSRADCARCAGHQVATVSFTSEVAFCHRCKWRSNTLALARELGLLATDPESRRLRHEEARRIAEYRRIVDRFESWRDALVRKYSSELRQLGRSAALAKEALASDPDWELAWDALARFCHNEGRLNQLLDFLTFAKASPWLEENSEPLDLFEWWKENVDGPR